jgi:SulP family sulfate permease
MGDLLVRLKNLSSLALSIALLGSIESLLSAVVADGMSGDRHDSNTELIAQGVANLASPLIGGMPATGVIARTSTNIRAGARSPFAGVFHSLTVLAAVLAAGPLVGHVPLAALAGVLLVVCWSMAELRHWPHILKAGRSDAVLLPLAFVLTAFIGVTEAIEVCVVLAMFFFVKRMSEATEVERHTAPATDAGALPPIAPGVEVYSIRGPFFFGASTLIRDLDGGAGAQPRVMVLRLGAVPFIDATAAFSLRELHATLLARGGRLLLSDVHARIAEDLRRNGLTDLLGADAAHADLAAALVHARRVSEGGEGR